MAAAPVQLASRGFDRSVMGPSFSGGNIHYVSAPSQWPTLRHRRRLWPPVVSPSASVMRCE